MEASNGQVNECNSRQLSSRKPLDITLDTPIPSVLLSVDWDVIQNSKSGFSKKITPHHSVMVHEPSATERKTGFAAEASATSQQAIVNIIDSDKRSSAFLDNSKRLTNIRALRGAERVAGLISDRWKRIEALNYLINALVEIGKYFEAKRVAFSLPSEIEQSSALEKIAKAQITDNKLEAAEKTAKVIPGSIYRASSTEGIVNAFIKRGDLGEAERVAQSITSEIYRSSALGNFFNIVA